MRSPISPEVLIALYAIPHLIRSCVEEIEAGRVDESYLAATFSYFDQLLLDDLVSGKCKLHQEDDAYSFVYYSTGKSPLYDLKVLMGNDTIENSTQLVDVILENPNEVANALEEILRGYIQAFMNNGVRWEMNVMPWDKQCEHVLTVLHQMELLYGSPFWVSVEGFFAQKAEKVLGLKLIETILALHQGGQIALGIVRRYPQEGGGIVEIETKLGRDQDVNRNGNRYIRLTTTAIRYQNIITDFDSNRMWNAEESRERQKQERMNESALKTTWKTLLEAWQRSEAVSITHLKEIITEEHPEVTRPNLENILEGLIQKLSKVSDIHRSEVNSWIERNEESIKLT